LPTAGRPRTQVKLFMLGGLATILTAFIALRG
jgi:hypothetical protein